MRALNGRAYAGSDNGKRFIESYSEETNPDAKNIIKGISQAAPDVAKYRAMEEAGDRHKLSIHEDITDAVQIYRRIKKVGRETPEEYLQQTRLDGEVLEPAGQVMLQTMDALRTSPSKLKDVVQRYYELAEQQGDPKQRGLLVNDPPSKAELLKRAVKDTINDLEPIKAEIQSLKKQLAKAPSKQVPKIKKEIAELETKAANVFDASKLFTKETYKPKPVEKAQEAVQDLKRAVTLGDDEAVAFSKAKLEQMAETMTREEFERLFNKTPLNKMQKIAEEYGINCG